MRLLCLGIILAALFSCGLCIYTHIDQRRDFCIYKRMMTGDKLNVNYVSSGQNEERVRLQIFDPEGQEMGSISDEREGNIDINANQPGLFKICWRGLDNIPKTLSFDVSIGEKIEKKVASTENIDQVGGEVKKAYKSLEQIYRNQHYQYTREEVHRGGDKLL